MACAWWEGGCNLQRQDPEVGSLSATLRREQGLASSPLLMGVPKLPKFSAWGPPLGRLEIWFQAQVAHCTGECGWGYLGRPEVPSQDGSSVPAL